MKSRTATRARAVQAENFSQGVTRGPWTDCSSAGRRLVEAAAGWDEFLLLASGAGQPSSLEPLPNFGEIAPHIM